MQVRDTWYNSVYSCLENSAIKESVSGYEEGEKIKRSVFYRLNCYMFQVNIEEVSKFGAQEQGQG